MKKKSIIVLAILIGVALLLGLAHREHAIFAVVGADSHLSDTSEFKLHVGQIYTLGAVGDTSVQPRQLQQESILINRVSSRLLNVWHGQEALRQQIVQRNFGNNTSVDESGLGFLVSAENYASVESQNNEMHELSVIYITENSIDRVISCTVIKGSYDVATAGGTNSSHKIPIGISHCQIVVKGLSNPQNIMVNQQKLYIVNYANARVTACDLDRLGNVSGCMDIALPLMHPVYITQPSSQQIYVSSFPESGLVKMVSCAVDSDGGLHHCGNPATINKNLLPQGEVHGYTYVSNYFNNAIDKCSNNSCKMLTGIALTQPLSIYVSQNSAYIANADSLVGCGVDATTGDLFACKVLAHGLHLPLGIAQYVANQQI